MNAQKLVIYYDGACPFCKNYVRILRIREAIGTIQLINLRDDSQSKTKLESMGIDLDEGMVANHNGKYYHGADCVQFLALLSSPSGVFNKMNKAILSNPTRANVLYPVMRSGRNTLLKLLGVSKLKQK